MIETWIPSSNLLAPIDIVQSIVAVDRRCRVVIRVLGHLAEAGTLEVAAVLGHEGLGVVDASSERDAAALAGVDDRRTRQDHAVGLRDLARPFLGDVAALTHREAAVVAIDRVVAVVVALAGDDLAVLVGDGEVAVLVHLELAVRGFDVDRPAVEVDVDVAVGLLFDDLLGDELARALATSGSNERQAGDGGDREDQLRRAGAGRCVCAVRVHARNMTSRFRM